jgi:hypothetical protein
VSSRRHRHLSAVQFQNAADGRHKHPRVVLPAQAGRLAKEVPRTGVIDMNGAKTLLQDLDDSIARGCPCEARARDGETGARSSEARRALRAVTSHSSTNVKCAAVCFERVIPSKMRLRIPRSGMRSSPGCERTGKRAGAKRPGATDSGLGSRRGGAC